MMGLLNKWPIGKSNKNKVLVASRFVFFYSSWSLQQRGARFGWFITSKVSKKKKQLIKKPNINLGNFNSCFQQVYEQLDVFCRTTISIRDLSEPNGSYRHWQIEISVSNFLLTLSKNGFRVAEDVKTRSVMSAKYIATSASVRRCHRVNLTFYLWQNKFFIRSLLWIISRNFEIWVRNKG